MSANDNILTEDLRTYLLAGNPYDDRIDIRSDGVIIYGHQNYERRAHRWRQQGYSTHFMTGLSSGSYDEYLSGKFDNEKHYHERQQNPDGSRWERNPSLYHLTPTPPFIEYLKSIIKTVIDAGADSVFLTQPEYAAETGYSAAFKDAWRSFYEQTWQDPWSSVQSRYMSGHLKQNLFLYGIDELTTYAKSYAASQRKEIKCYVALQSLINYTHWGIVSPHSQLLDIQKCDGLLAMVSTTTARTPNIYNGLRRERTFETALLEYSSFVHLIKGTQAELIFMQDPVEEYEEYPWEDYKQNYEATVTASLMFPGVFRFLTVPWPKRIFTAHYTRKNMPLDEKKPIPREYATEVLIVNNAMKNMYQPQAVWDRNYSKIGLLISDSMMLQRGGPSSTDEDLSFFYGLAMPLVKHGVLPQIMPLEHTAFAGFLDSVRILIFSYKAMKPMRPDYHAIIAEWVKAGNLIIFIDDLADPFNKVVDWWNSGMYQYDSPAQHLFELLGIGRNPEFDDVYFVGRGRVILRKMNPADIANSADRGQEYLEMVQHATHYLGRSRSRFRLQNYVRLRRGPYEIAAVFDESHSLKPLKLRGRLIDLFDAELTYARKFILQRNQRGFYFNLSRINRRKPCIVASASATQNIIENKGFFAFRSIGPSNTQCITKIYIPRKPHIIEVSKSKKPYPHKASYERVRRILTLQYENDVMGVQIRITYPVPKYHLNLDFMKKLFSGKSSEDVSTS